MGGVKLAGTLVEPLLPAGQRVPGVVILPGGGPTDRNGNDNGSNSGPDLYKMMATALADAGIASLRYDKRGVGGSDPTPGDIGPATDFAAWENYVGDAVASLRYLQRQPEIDALHTALVGHSEGSILAEQTAIGGIGFTNPPVALVLVSGPGRPFDMVVRDQIAKTVNEQTALGTPQETAQLLLTTYDQTVAGIKQNGQIPAEPLEALQNERTLSSRVKNQVLSLFDSTRTKFWSGIVKADPAKLAAQYRGPVLVIQGGKDTQVAPTEDAPALDAALKSRPNDNHELFVVPNASHWLKAVQDQTTESGTEGPIVPEAASKLTSWLTGRLNANIASDASSAEQQSGAPMVALVMGGVLILVVGAIVVLLRKRPGSAAPSP